MDQTTHHEEVKHEATTAEQPTEVKRTAGKYVVIYHKDGEVSYDEVDDKKTFSKLLSNLVEAGHTVEKVYKGAKPVQAKVTQKVSVSF